MQETLAVAADAVGIVVGLAALSLSVWVILVHREQFDSSYVAALYILGTLIVFLSFEVDIAPSYFVIFGRMCIYTAVGIWELVVYEQLRAGSPFMDRVSESLDDMMNNESEDENDDEEASPDSIEDVDHGTRE